MDDIVFGGHPDSLIITFVKQMKTEFEMSMVGKLNFFLGFQIHQSETEFFLSQSQEKYALNLMKFELEQAEVKQTPAATHVKVLADNAGKKVDESLYRSIIGSLLYLTAS